jgi:hypothetical protein
MRVPRFSIALLMLVVLVAAIDCVAVPAGLGGAAGESAVAALFGSLPMANVLMLGALPLVQGPPGRAPARPFLAGFELFGWGAVGLQCLLSFLAPDLIAAYVELLLQPVGAGLEAIGLGSDPVLDGLLELATILAAFLVPQVFFALMGSRRGRRQAERDRRMAEIERKVDRALAILADLSERLNLEGEAERVGARGAID